MRGSVWMAVGLALLLASACSSTKTSKAGGVSGKTSAKGGASAGRSGATSSGGTVSGGTGGTKGGSGGTMSGASGGGTGDTAAVSGGSGGTGAVSGGTAGSSQTGVDPNVHFGNPFGFSADKLVCAVHSDCAVFYNTCCNSCPATVADYFGMNKKYAGEVGPLCCDMEGPNGQCPVYRSCRKPCDPYMRFLPACAGGSCGVIDLSRHQVAACTTDAQCVARVGGCCPCGAGAMPLLGNIAAINGQQIDAFQRLFCDTPVAACDTCVQKLPDGIGALCVDGHCKIQ